jgi:hypothetical protein
MSPRPDYEEETWSAAEANIRRAISILNEKVNQGLPITDDERACIADADAYYLAMTGEELGATEALGFPG